MWGSRRRRQREIEDLAALADGTLDPERRAQLEARVAESPELQTRLLEQQEALAAIRGLDQRPPQRLREALAAGRPPPRRLLRPVLAVGVALAATAAVLAWPGAEPLPPTMAAATALGARQATSARPVPRRAVGRKTREDPMLVGIAIEGIHFPDWKPEYGWRAYGSRVDRFGARRATTVFYEKRRHRVAYTIISGGPMNIPRSSRMARWEGELRHVFLANGRVGVTWQRRGHTCLLSAHGLRRRTLVKLSA